MMWIVIDYIALPASWIENAEEYEIVSNVDSETTKVFPTSHANCRELCELYFITNKLYSLWDEGYLAGWVTHDVLSSVFKGGE